MQPWLASGLRVCVGCFGLAPTEANYCALSSGIYICLQILYHKLRGQTRFACPRLSRERASGGRQGQFEALTP